MTIATLPALRFGKHPPKADYRNLRLADYLTPSLPPPPPSSNNLDRIRKSLGIKTDGEMLTLFPMLLNDRYGDCTIAGVAHADTAWAALIGKRKVMTDAAVKKVYFSLSGGVDSGLNELDVLNYWRKNGIGGEKILAFAGVKPKNHLHVQQTINLFGSCYIGFQVQENAIADFDAHRPWTPGKLTEDGHAVVAIDYDADGLVLLTWGGIQRGTWDWWDECTDESWAVLPKEAADPKFCPGFNSAQLLADLKAVAS